MPTVRSKRGAVHREFFGAIPFAPRVFYLTSSNEVVKSFDMVHVRYLDEEVELWLGEAKFFTDRQKAIASAIASVSSHIQQGFLNNEKLILGPQVSTDIPNFEKIRDILSAEASLDVLFERAVFPIFIAANSKAAASHKKWCDDYTAEVANELQDLAEQVKKSGLSSKIKIILIYVPVASKDGLAKAFDERLKGLNPC